MVLLPIQCVCYNNSTRLAPYGDVPAALDLTAISTALPTITDDLQGGDKFVWVGAAYGLASAAVLPLSGRFADAFGRRPVMLAVVALFLVGSAISGAAKNMNMLIAGRSEYLAFLDRRKERIY